MLQKIDKLGKVAITVDENDWIITKAYDRLHVVYCAEHGISYLSRIPVPKGTSITNRKYWVPLGRENATVTIGTFTVLGSTSDLPLTEASYNGPYLIDGIAYFWVGTDGDTLDGKYQSVTIKGEIGATGSAGPQGEVGPQGQAGDSAYVVAMKEKYGQNSNISEWDTKATWLASLKGEQGDKGDPLTFDQLTEKQKAELKGQQGDKGDKGDSAYTVAMKERYPDILPSEWPSIATWLESLVGPQGPRGYSGRDGTPGKNGDVITHINYDEEENKLIFTIKSYQNTGINISVTKTISVQMPEGWGQGGGAGQTVYVREQVLELNVGTLDEAKAYAVDTENRNTYYQWLLVDTATIEENGEQVTVPVRKVLWHIPHSTYYEYIDAMGGIMVCENFNGQEVNPYNN